jgi:hypothetical protein
MKRLSMLVPALALALSLAACGGGGDAAPAAGGADADPPASSEGGGNGAAVGNLLDRTKSGTFYYETETTSTYEGEQYEGLDLGNTVYRDTYAKDGDDYAKISEETDENGVTKKIQSFKRGGEMYVINHDEKAYMRVPEELEAMGASLQDAFSGVTNKVGEGTGEIDGKTLPYEEYDTDGISTKYFLDNGQVYGYISETMGITTVSVIVKQSGKVPSELFEIPAGYTEIEPPSE